MSSGNPAYVEPEKVYAYLALDVIVELAEGVDPGEYRPEPIKAGEFVVRYDFPGTGTHSFVFEYGPFKTIVTGVYAATGTIGDDGTSFDYGNGKVMNLLSLGIQGESILKEQIHEVLDKVKEAIEPIHGAGIEEIVKAIDVLEAGLWRKH